jgi:chromosome segregation ATPase
MSSENFANYYVELLSNSLHEETLRKISSLANCKVLEELVRESNRKNEELTNLISELNTKCFNYETHIENMGKEINDKNIQINEVNNLRNQLQHLDSYRNQLTNTQSELVDVTNKLLNKEKEINELNDSISTKNSMIINLEKEIKNLENKNKKNSDTSSEKKEDVVLEKKTNKKNFKIGSPSNPKFIEIDENVKDGGTF